MSARSERRHAGRPLHLKRRLTIFYVSSTTNHVNLERAQSSLQAARLCLNERLFDSAASRAYFAMFMMAICALENRGIKRSEWTHKGVHSDFVFNFVRGRKIVPASFASALPTAMEIRHVADYRQPGASRRQAERVVRLAGEFSERLSTEMLNASNP